MPKLITRIVTMRLAKITSVFGSLVLIKLFLISNKAVVIGLALKNIKYLEGIDESGYIIGEP